MGMYTVMTPVELVLGSIMAIALTIYLVYAMLRPEKFYKRKFPCWEMR